MHNKRLLSPSFLKKNLPNFLRHEGFRENPVVVLLRAIRWAFISMFQNQIIFRIDRYGSLMRVAPNERRVGASSAFIFRDSAEPELKGLEKLIREGDVFVDCGANIGIFSIKAASIVGKHGRVVSIEPGAESVERLRKNILLNAFSNVVILNKAASDRQGTSRLYHSGGGPVAYSLVAQPGAEFEDVEVTTLDAIAADENLPSVDCIKIDVEGAEASVIEGAKKLLARWKPTVIFEINSAGTMRSGVSPSAAWDLLRSFGYSFFLMRFQKLQPLNEYPRIAGNIVAIARTDRMQRDRT